MVNIEITNLFHKVIKYPLITEKVITEIESKKKITFIVEKNASKSLINHAISNYFNVEILSINTSNTSKGLKKAIVTFKETEQATEVAVTLGVI